MNESTVMAATATTMTRFSIHVKPAFDRDELHE